MMSLNYSKEKELIDAASADSEDKNWFKPTGGAYKVKFLEELSELKTYTAKDGKEYKKVFVKIEVDGEVYTWSIGHGISMRSLYGQIVALGAAWDGLTNREINLVVKYDSKEKKREFTVLEAQELDNQSQATAKATN